MTKPRPEERVNRKPKEKRMIKEVRRSGDSGHVYLPPALIGRFVRVTVLTQEEEVRYMAELNKAAQGAEE